jgi:hypothetical protein
MVVNIQIGMEQQNLIMLAQNITLMLHLLMLGKLEHGMTYPIQHLVGEIINLKVI